jgi:hypothetical protein
MVLENIFQIWQCLFLILTSITNPQISMIMKAFKSSVLKVYNTLYKVLDAMSEE